VQIVQQFFLADDAAAFVEMHARMMLERQGADEQIALPGGKLSRDTRRVGGSDRRSPIDHGLFQSRPLGVGRNIGARVIHSVGDDRPAVVLVRHDDVEFVAPRGPCSVRRAVRFARQRPSPADCDGPSYRFPDARSLPMKDCPAARCRLREADDLSQIGREVLCLSRYSNPRRESAQRCRREKRNAAA